MKDEWPCWLDHFRHYNDTGEYINCKLSEKNDCPIHGKSSYK
jgi:DtxR family Mn-dependent transcriptional regulator